MKEDNSASGIILQSIGPAMTNPLHAEVDYWRAPQSSFQIQYSRMVLEQIRLAVVDAYFLVPRGGLEIGGVLLGKHRDRQIEVIDHEPIDCEHAFGPSFSLSLRDQERLKEVLASIRGKSGGLDAVGWYHSHTRSEISLREADLEIHNRYFPESWQVALVVRPSTSQPTRAGFFYRELGGSIHASGSYLEFQLDPLRAGGPKLLKAEGDAPVHGNGNSNNGASNNRTSDDFKAGDPAVALLTTPPMPLPAINRLPISPASTRPPRERPIPLATDHPPLRERQVTFAANSLRPMERALRATALGMPPRERPAPLISAPSPPRERPSAGTGDLRPQDRPLGLNVNLQPPLEHQNGRTALFGSPLEDLAGPTQDLPRRARRVNVIVDPPPLREPPVRLAADPRLKPPVTSTQVRRADPGRQGVEIPRFLSDEAAPQTEWTRVPIRILGIVCLVLVALGTLAFVERDAVVASIGGLASRVVASREAGQSPGIGPAMSINADYEGQLEIRWDTSSPALQAPRSAVLSIVDGGSVQRLPLDGAHLHAGAVTYTKHGVRVDARLTIVTAEGTSIEAATTFLGAPTPTEEEKASTEEKAAAAGTGAPALAKQNVQLRRQLDEQIARSKSLQTQLDRLRKQPQPSRAKDGQP